MSMQISFSSISFILVSQDTVGTIFGTGLQTLKTQVNQVNLGTQVNQVHWFTNLAETLHGNICALLSGGLHHPEDTGELSQIQDTTLSIRFYLDLQVAGRLGSG